MLDFASLGSEEEDMVAISSVGVFWSLGESTSYFCSRGRSLFWSVDTTV